MGKSTCIKGKIPLLSYHLLVAVVFAVAGSSIGYCDSSPYKRHAFAIIDIFITISAIVVDQRSSYNRNACVCHHHHHRLPLNILQQKRLRLWGLAQQPPLQHAHDPVLQGCAICLAQRLPGLAGRESILLVAVVATAKAFLVNDLVAAAASGEELTREVHTREVLGNCVPRGGGG
jgi:hypothetical protein